MSIIEDNKMIDLRQPRKNDRMNCVKLYFTSNYTYVGSQKKNAAFNFVIGNNIVETLGWRKGTKLSLLSSSSIPFFLGKCSEGTCLLRVPRSNSHQLSLKAPYLPEERRTRNISHQIIEDGDKKYLQLDLDFYFNQEGQTIDMDNLGGESNDGH